MPPKGKKGPAKKPAAGGGGAAVANKNWEAGLTAATLDEDSWKACVCWLVGGGLDAERVVQALVLAVQKPERKLFSVLTLENTIAKIHEFGNTKGKKFDDVPMYFEVTEAAKGKLDAEEPLPSDMMARILKFQLLHVKTKDLQRRAAEQALIERAKAPPKVTKAPEKKGKNQPPPAPPVEKKTNLKRRDDVEPPHYIDDEPEDGPEHYILITGFYQPQLIWLLDSLGVHVSNVIKLSSERRDYTENQHEELNSEETMTLSSYFDAETPSVELMARASNLELFWSGLRPVLDNAPPESKLFDVAQLNYSVPGLLRSMQLVDLDSLLEFGSKVFHGVAHLIYDCLEWRRQHQHYIDNITLISVPSVVGLDSQPKEVVPPTPPPVTPPTKKKGEVEVPVQVETPPPQDVELRHYNNLLNLVPPEACSVPLILHCLLEQVVISLEKSDPTNSCVPEKPKPLDGSWLECELAGHMLQSFLPVALTDEERSQMLNNFVTVVENEEDKKKLVEKYGADKTQKKLDNPLVIRHHNDRALRLRNISAVDAFDPAEVELSMMKLSPVWNLIHSVAELKKSDSCWMANKQQLQHYCTDDDVSWPQVELLLHQGVFEMMPLTALDRKGVLQNPVGVIGALETTSQLQTPTVIPWDNPLSFAKQQLQKLQSNGLEDPGNTEQFSRGRSPHLSLSDIQSCRLRSLFDWYYTEHHDASIFPQVLQRASEEFRCLDTFRGGNNDTLYIFCHNPRNSDYQCKEFWDVALHTDVKFRKYLEHVADIISDWTQEGLKREATRVKHTESVKEQEEKVTDSVKEEVALEPFIRKESLKAWKLEQERQKEDDTSQKSKTKGKGGAAKPPENKKGKPAPAGKKDKGKPGGPPSKSPTTPVPPVDEKEVLEKKGDVQEPEKHLKCYVGYSMDGKVIHVSGCHWHLFPSDGGHVTVETINYVEGSNLMKVAVRKDDHRFYTHIDQLVITPAPPPPQPQDNPNGDKKEECQAAEPVGVKTIKEGSLSAVLNNGVHLSYSFYGPTGECKNVIAHNQEEKPGYINPMSMVSAPVSSSHLPVDVQPDTLPKQPSTSMIASLEPCVQSEEAGQFNSLQLSVPNGLLLEFQREDTQEDAGLLVRQSYPLHGRHKAAQLQDPSLCKEFSRVVTTQGTVIRHMRDGSTEVLFADGSVSSSPDGGPVWVADSQVEVEVESAPTTPIPADGRKKEQTPERPVQTAVVPRGCWLTTTPYGARIRTVGSTHKHLPTTPLLAFTATDPVTNEVMLSRQDLMISVQSPDGSLSVQFADGTRITTFYQGRLSNTGESSESVTPIASPGCVCGCTECVCIIENVDIQDTGDAGNENGQDNALGTSGMEGDHPQLNMCEQDGDKEECDDNTPRENGEETATGEDGDMESVLESDKGSMTATEKMVLVEKEGCASVLMYPERQAAHVYLADGTVITGDNQGAYQVFPANVGLLQIQSNGKCVYSSDSYVAPSMPGGTPTSQIGNYTMSHTGSVAFEVTDMDGNHFQVLEDGQVSVENISPAPSILKRIEEEQEEEDDDDRKVEWPGEKPLEQSLRLFLVHEDGSGTELLNSQSVEEHLYQAYSDPTIAVLKEPPPDTQDSFCVTLLKPSHQNVWSQWTLEKQNADITPPNLRNRSWHDFPNVERKTEGPPFATNVGRGLTLSQGSPGPSAKEQIVRSCPDVLEMRELYQHRPITRLFKYAIDARLKEYIENLMKREQQSEDSKVKDPRTEEECVQASNLLNQVLSVSGEENENRNPHRRSSVDIGSLYSHGIRAQYELSDASENTSVAASECMVDMNESKWTERHSNYRLKMSEHQTCKDALRGRISRSFVPYFHPENIALYQDILQTPKPDMKRLTMDLPPIPKSADAEALFKDAPQDTSLSSNTLAAPRPLNPTPSKSAIRAAERKETLEGRPTNPTPQTAGDSNVTSGPFKTMNVDVTGKPRKKQVRLPASLLGSKPFCVPNEQFLSVEEPVRRRCRTISVALTNMMRGFELIPPTVNFGTVQEGKVAAITVLMRNVGIDTCRFHVKQPHSTSGLRVLYSPMPVAAGLQAELQIQLFAKCTAQAGEVEPKKYISQDIIIQTEADILYLPVTATILPERFYDIWLKEWTSAHTKSSSRPRRPRRPDVQGIGNRRFNTSSAATPGPCPKPKI